MFVSRTCAKVNKQDSPGRMQLTGSRCLNCSCWCPSDNRGVSSTPGAPLSKNSHMWTLLFPWLLFCPKSQNQIIQTVSNRNVKHLTFMNALRRGSCRTTNIYSTNTLSSQDGRASSKGSGDVKVWHGNSSGHSETLILVLHHTSLDVSQRWDFRGKKHFTKGCRLLLLLLLLVRLGLSWRR